MADAGPSEEDKRLLQELGDVMTFDQLRRYRSDGAIPQNKRRGLGRGTGSTSRAHEDTLLIAKALATVMRPGRARAECVLEVFAAQPHVPVPEAGVKKALY
ncbi:hypothetical protein AB0D58_31825 [Streptomyces sp. NPDC048210]|uniref:hypothetical protein n=1 Tax=Streptomyces sp. NPDC048210 TaxID=3156657 RepID=UPI0034478AE9